jgi:signal transduction histidine kinase
VVTAPSAVPTERSPAALRRDDVLWWTAVATFASLVVMDTLLLLAESPLHDAVAYPSVEALAVGCILLGVRRFRPARPQAWLAIAAGVFVWFLGDLIWGIYEWIGNDPFPSIADFFYLAGYPLMALGLVLAIRSRNRALTLEPGTLIDVVLVTAITALFSWDFVINPVIHDNSLSVSQKVVSIAYPLGDLLLVAVATRFVMGTRWGVPALRLLVCGLGLTLLGDVIYSASAIEGDSAEIYWSTSLLIGAACFGLAGLSPSMSALTEVRRHDDVAPEPLRQILLGIAVLTPPGLLVVQTIRGEPLYLGMTIFTMIVVSALVVVRFAYVTNRARRAAARESVLRRYAGELLTTHDEEALRAAAIRAASTLAGGGRVALVDPGQDPEKWVEFVVPVDVRKERIAELAVGGEPVHVQRAHDSLIAVAAQLSLAIERERLLEAEREAAEALVEQNERLIEIDRMKDRFVSSVSHELRTPLTSMVGYLELLVGGEDELDEEERAHFLEIVNRNCLRLNRLVDDILFVARVDAGRLSLEREGVDFGELAASAVESARAAASGKGIDLQLSVEEGLPQLEADSLRLTQMLDNLISNAVKFTPAGGTVTVSVSSSGAGIRLAVADTGVGIPADEVDRVFDRFFRASSSSVAQGTGLGLSIVKSIVDVHGGTISVESTEGVGTTFAVDLPARVPTEALGDAEPAPTEVAR